MQCTCSAKLTTTLSLSSSSYPLLPITSLAMMISSPPKSRNCRFAASIRSKALAVNYSSPISVFPAEACEIIGGEACDVVNIYPEVKLKPEAKTMKPTVTSSEPIEREYLDYTDTRTVLLGDACDVLGGDFCEGPYQIGIFITTHDQHAAA